MKKLMYLSTCVLIFSLFLSSCSPSGTETGSNTDMKGTITISGAWALYPMMVSWGEEFQAQYPDVQFDISAGGAGKGMSDALAGAVDIGMVSREIHPEEIDQGAYWVSVVKDAVFLVVNENNPVWNEIHQQGITAETLAGIYITGEITTWGQVVNRPEVTDPIHVFTRSDACGAAETWASYLGKKQEDLLGIGIYGDPGILDAVIKDPLGIGYNNLNFAFDMDTQLPVAGARISPLDVNGNGSAESVEIYDTKEQAVKAVASGDYPSPPARDLNLVTKGKPTGLVQAFITWILTDGQQYVDAAGYIPLSPDVLSSQQDKLN
jgi:phosphate transport system substrate-binding protein